MPAAKPLLVGSSPVGAVVEVGDGVWARELTAADGRHLLAIDKQTDERVPVTEAVTVEFGLSGDARPEVVAGEGTVEDLGGGRWSARVAPESHGPLLLRIG